MSAFEPERGEDGYLALPCGSLFLNFEEWNREHRPGCATCLGNFGETPTPEHHNECSEWCNHCLVCGTGIVWGSLCQQHYNVGGPMPVNTLETTGHEPRDAASSSSES